MADPTQVAALGANFNTSPPGTSNGTVGNTSTTSASESSSGNPLYDQIMTQLQQQSGVVSSSDQTINDSYNKAISTLQGGSTSADQGIQSQYQLKENQQDATTQQNITSVEEASRGYATNYALLGQLQKQGKDAINDLELQKNSLIMSGDADAAKSISALQVQQATDLLANRQKVFDNLISLAGVANSAQQTKIQQQQVDDAKAQATASIALKYGVQQKPGDTLQDIVNRAMPQATQEEKLALMSTQADIDAKRAQTNLYNAQAAAANNKISTTDLTAMAQSVAGKYGLPDYQNYKNAALATLKTPSEMQAFAKALDAAQTPRNWSDQEVQSYAVALAGEGVSYSDAYQNVLNNVSIKNTASALSTLKDTYKQVDAASTYKSGAGFVAPGNLPPGGLAALPPLPPASAESVAALKKSLQGTAFGR